MFSQLIINARKIAIKKKTSVQYYLILILSFVKLFQIESKNKTDCDKKIVKLAIACLYNYQPLLCKFTANKKAIRNINLCVFYVWAATF